MCPNGRCPDEEKFAQYAEGKLSADERGAFLEHIAECESCSAEFYFLIPFPNQTYASLFLHDLLGVGSSTPSRRRAKAASPTLDLKTELHEYRFESKLKKISHRNRKKNVFQLCAIAAMIALVIGFAARDVRDVPENADVLESFSQAPREQDVAKNEIYETNSLPPMAAAPNIGMAPMTDTAQEPAETENFESPRRERARLGYAAPAPVVYEVIYNGHDGDKTEISRLIREIMGIGEESADIIAEGGKKSVVIKKCASMAEAQKIKKELESFGAKVEIKSY